MLRVLAVGRRRRRRSALAGVGQESRAIPAHQASPLCPHTLVGPVVCVCVVACAIPNTRRGEVSVGLVWL